MKNIFILTSLIASSYAHELYNVEDTFGGLSKHYAEGIPSATPPENLQELTAQYQDIGSGCTLTYRSFSQHLGDFLIGEQVHFTEGYHLVPSNQTQLDLLGVYTQNTNALYSKLREDSLQVVFTSHFENAANIQDLPANLRLDNLEAASIVYPTSPNPYSQHALTQHVFYVVRPEGDFGVF